MTLNEARSIIGEYSHYLMVISLEDTGESTTNTTYQVLDVLEETARATKVVLTTVGHTKNAQYRYTVYGQNSDTNIDPTDASVVGEVEIGMIVLTDNPSAYITPDDGEQTVIYA